MDGLDSNCNIFYIGLLGQVGMTNVSHTLLKVRSLSYIGCYHVPAILLIRVPQTHGSLEGIVAAHTYSCLVIRPAS